MYIRIKLKTSIMSALLKIITDVDCDLYVDFEYKEHLTVGKMSKLEIQRGTYILEFKIDDVTIHSEDYYVPSNDEEFLYQFKFIENNKSRIIQYESQLPNIRLCSRTIKYAASLTKKIKVNEECFDQQLLLHHCADNGMGIIIFRDTITRIGNEAFAACSNLKSIYIPDNIIHIGRAAFRGCTNISFEGKYSSDDHHSLIVDDTLIAFAPNGLTHCTVPDGVITIGKDAFYGSECIMSITLPDSLITIENGAFHDCQELRSIELPYGVISIGASVFYNCYKLESVTLHNGVEMIDEYAFAGCRSLKSIQIPDSVVEIGKHAFIGCKEIRFNGNYASADHRCLIVNGGLRYFSSNGVKEYTIPAEVTSIEESSCSHSGELQRVIIPEGVTSIEMRSFEFCEYLFDVHIPNTVTSIGHSAFFGCSLSKIIIPESVQSIGAHAFISRWGMIDIYIKSINPPSLMGTLGEVNNVRIYVPVDSLAEYKSDPGWIEYSDRIIAHTFPD